MMVFKQVKGSSAFNEVKHPEKKEFNKAGESPVWMPFPSPNLYCGYVIATIIG